MDTVQVTLTDLNQVDTFGNTKLHNAIINKNMSQIKNLLNIIIKNQKTDMLNLQNNDGDTPLHLAVRHYPLHIIGNILLGIGAEPDITNNNGEKVCIAETFKEYLQNTELTIDLDFDNNDEELSHLSILDDEVEEYDNDDDDNFPTYLSVEEKPQLINNGEIFKIINTDNNSSLKEQTVKSFIENLMRQK
jgi:ankyrin repeat protein